MPVTIGILTRATLTHATFTHPTRPRDVDPLVGAIRIEA